MRRLRLAALAGAALLSAGSAPATASGTPTASLSWLTPELVATVDAAGPAGVPLPPGALPELTSSSFAFTGIRPGSLVTRKPDVDIEPFDVEAGGLCTANFVFQETAGTFDPSGQLYLGTAGHCVELGDRVLAVVTAPGTTTPVVVDIGEVVVDTPNYAEDFAVIELDPALNGWVSPSVAHWGGPTGVYTGGAGIVVTFTGQGGGATGGTPRVGLLDGIESTRFSMVTLAVAGDSGAPVLTTDGLAIGESRGSNASGGEPIPDPAVIQPDGPTIAVMAGLAGAALATCPTRTPWPLPGCPTL